MKGAAGYDELPGADDPDDGGNASSHPPSSTTDDPGDDMYVTRWPLEDQVCPACL